MIHFDGKSIDLLVTPNHQMLVTNNEGEQCFKDAEYFIRRKTTAYHIPLTSKRITSARGTYHGIPAKTICDSSVGTSLRGLLDRTVRSPSLKKNLQIQINTKRSAETLMRAVYRNCA